MGSCFIWRRLEFFCSLILNKYSVRLKITLTWFTCLCICSFRSSERFANAVLWVNRTPAYKIYKYAIRLWVVDSDELFEFLLTLFRHHGNSLFNSYLHYNTASVSCDISDPWYSLFHYISTTILQKDVHKLQSLYQLINVCTTSSKILGGFGSNSFAFHIVNSNLLKYVYKNIN